MKVESDPESDVDVDMEGCIEPDNDEPQQMGDSLKEPTEEEIDKSSELRAQAAAAYSEQKYVEAISFYTEAIQTNPTNALFYAKRGQAFLKLKKPNACVRDCDRALELNCDSAAAFKFRGRAHRLLGNWIPAAADLRQACKLDFDEEADEWLREVQPNAKKIEQHKIKQERKTTEKELRDKQERIKRAQEANKKASEEQTKFDPRAFDFGNGGTGTGAGAGGTGTGGGADFSQADILNAFKDPEVSAALQDIMTNPGNISKYQSNPKVMGLISKIGMAMEGGGGGAGGGFPGMFPGAGGFPGFGAGTGPTGGANTDSTKKPPPPTDFQDDGLD